MNLKPEPSADDVEGQSNLLTLALLSFLVGAASSDDGKLHAAPADAGSLLCGHGGTDRAAPCAHL
jgi:hypothetical protein